MAKEKNAVIYARYSSHNQREESIEQQVAECKLFAAANGYAITNIYADTAKTGKTERRPQFQKLKRDAEKRKFDFIIAYKSNRIARNMLNALQFENEMQKHDIAVLYAKEEFGNNAAGRFALRTMMNVNQFFSENMAEDIKRNQEDNARNCKANGPASFGYKSGKDGKFVIDEPAATIVREIFERTANGEPFVDIASDFNRRGLRTRKGNPWGKSSFANILNNERYMGVYIFDGIRVEGGMPEIISKEMFYKVKDVLKNKKNPQGRHRENGDYLLTGKIFCGECEHPMVGISGTGSGGVTYYYYTCNGKRSGSSCTKQAVRRDIVETAVAQKIQEYILQPGTMEWIADTVLAYQKELKIESEVTSLDKRLKETEKAIRNIIAYIEKGVPLPEAMETRMNELEEERKELAANLAVMKANFKPVTKEQVITWLSSFKDGNCTDKEYKRQLFSAFLNAVYLYDDGTVKITFSASPKDTFNTKLPEDSGSRDVCIKSCTGHHTRAIQTNEYNLTLVDGIFVLKCQLE